MDDLKGYIVWHRLNGDIVKLFPIAEKLDRSNPVINIQVWDDARDASLRPWRDEPHTGAPGNSVATRDDDRTP